MLTISPAQASALAGIPRQALVERMLASGRMTGATDPRRLRALIEEAVGRGVTSADDVEDLCRLLLEMDNYGGRPPGVIERLDDAEVRGRLKVFQVRYAWRQMLQTI